MKKRADTMMEKYYCESCCLLYNEVEYCEVCGELAENKINIEVQSQSDKY